MNPESNPQGEASEEMLYVEPTRIVPARFITTISKVHLARPAFILNVGADSSLSTKSSLQRKNTPPVAVRLSAYVANQRSAGKKAGKMIGSVGQL